MLLNDCQILSPKSIHVVKKIIETILLVIGILVIISVVFVWLGAIETTIKRAG